MRLREAILFAGFGVAACLGAVAPIAAADTEPGALTGRVTNESGQPVAGAVVRVQLGADLLSSPETREATSDAEGNYSIPLPLGQFFVLPVQAPAGYWVKYQPQLPHALTRGDSTRQFDVVLRRGIPVNVKWGADL